MPQDPLYAGGGWGRDYQYYGHINGQRYCLRAALETTRLERTYNYPNGTTCQISGLPIASFYQDAVYDGYNSGCGRTLQLGVNYD